MAYQRIASTFLLVLAASALLLRHVASVDTWGDDMDDEGLSVDIDSDDLVSAGLGDGRSSGSSLRRRRSQWEGSQATATLKIEHDLIGSGTFVPAGSVTLSGRTVSGSTVSNAIPRWKVILEQFVSVSLHANTVIPSK